MSAPYFASVPSTAREVLEGKKERRGNEQSSSTALLRPEKLLRPCCVLLAGVEVILQMLRLCISTSRVDATEELHSLGCLVTSLSAE